MKHKLFASHRSYKHVREFKLQPTAFKEAEPWNGTWGSKVARLAGHPELRVGFVGLYPLSPHLPSLARVTALPASMAQTQTLTLKG